MNYRPQRVSSLIQEELGKIIVREVEFAEGVLVTITGVDVGAKLERAVVWLSVLSPGNGGPYDSGDAALAVLKKRAGELQHLLMKKINIKPMPRIEFQIDRGLENAAKIEKKFLDIG